MPFMSDMSILCNTQCSNAAKASALLDIHDTDKVFVIRNNVVFEYNHTTGKLVDSDYILTTPDYIAMVRQKISELCVGIKYETCDKYPFKTESYVFDTIVKAKVIDIFKHDVDISALKVKPIIEFLISINADVIELLKKSLGVEGMHPDLDIPTVCLIGIKILLDTGSEEDVTKLKKILLITDLIMKQIDKMKAAAKPTPDTNTKIDEKKEPDKKEDNKKGSSK